MGFDAAERNGRFGDVQCQRDKKSCSSGKRKRRVFLCIRTAGVKVGGKVIPASFRKLKEENARWGKRLGRERQIEELVGDQNRGPEASPRSMKGQERREQRRCQGRSDCQWNDVEGWVC